ncbi:MAG: internal scaffolding protein [Microviridae sp.]|nr:MAG: internal scaffolding protein [Microviridae sp.]
MADRKVVARNRFSARDASGDILCSEPTLAVQASKDECDINVIVRKYLRTGELPGLRQGVYADLSGMVGLQDALHMVNEAEQAFMELPAEVRRYFDNDPVKLVEFASDSKNLEKAIELGLAEKPVVTPPSQPVPVPGAGQAPQNGVPAGSGGAPKGA